jgi:hypothetical protein
MPVTKDGLFEEMDFLGNPVQDRESIRLALARFRLGLSAESNARL